MPLLALPQEQMTTLAFEEEEEDGHELLALPSDFTAKEIETYQIRVLATYELKLRVGLAFDLLREVRQAVQHSAVHLDEKIKHANSKTAHLREQSKIDVSRNLSKREARRYNHNYTRISTLRHLLGIPPSKQHMEANLQVIDLNQDLKMVSLTAGRSKGDGALLANASWIWSAFEPPDDQRVQPERKGKKKASPSGNVENIPWIVKGGVHRGY